MKEFLHRFGAQMVGLNLTEENMMVHAFRKGIVPGPFSESLIRNHLFRPADLGSSLRVACPRELGPFVLLRL